MIFEKRNRLTILSLTDALSFQMAEFFYSAATQTGKLQLNRMTTNLPAKTASATVVPTAAAEVILVVGSRRRVWW